jgi:UDP-glucuronate decarboxylase
MELEENFPGPINMGNPTEFTILELAENVIRLRKSKSKVVFRVLPQDDPMQRKPNSELVQRKLG